MHLDTPGTACDVRRIACTRFQSIELHCLPAPHSPAPNLNERGEVDTHDSQ
jgi:hypothetical protein